jgi:hypothetical protein
MTIKLATDKRWWPEHCENNPLGRTVKPGLIHVSISSNSENRRAVRLNDTREA